MKSSELQAATGVAISDGGEVGERLEIASKYYLAPYLRKLAHWLNNSKERTNFTYDLTENNRSQMESMASFICDTPFETIKGYVQELLDDGDLQAHHASMASQIPNMDTRLRPGRRIFWYALIRALKPRCVIETGVDKGMGSIIICAALIRNRAEGYEGDYFGTDINVKAGRLLSGPYAECGRILYGDSIASLEKFDQKIDLFINDSDHSADYEAREYQTIEGKLSPNAVLLGDNSHVTDRLSAFAHGSGRAFLFAAEAPKDHWYPGAGVGVAFPKTGAGKFQ